MQCNTQHNAAREEKVILLQDHEDVKAFQLWMHMEETGASMAPHAVCVSPNTCKHIRAEISKRIIYDALIWHPPEWTMPPAVIGNPLPCSEGMV